MAQRQRLATRKQVYALLGEPMKLGVFQALESEREHVEGEWGEPRASGEFILGMQEYLDDADNQYEEATEADHDRHLHLIRTVASLGVMCLEQHGLPGVEPDTRAMDGYPGPPGWGFEKFCEQVRGCLLMARRYNVQVGDGVGVDLPWVLAAVLWAVACMRAHGSAVWQPAGADGE